MPNSPASPGAADLCLGSDVALLPPNGCLDGGGVTDRDRLEYDDLDPDLDLEGDLDQWRSPLPPGGVLDLECGGGWTWALEVFLPRLLKNPPPPVVFLGGLPLLLLLKEFLSLELALPAGLPAFLLLPLTREPWEPCLESLSCSGGSVSG